MELTHTLREAFIARFNAHPTLICSPGRVNLIGEHTDYNEGFVLPAAIDKAIYLAVGPRPDDQLHLVAADLNETFTGSVTALQKTNSWADYLLGVVNEFAQAGLPVGGMNIVFGGTIPIGSGLSSSAALENGVALALDHLYNHDQTDRLHMVKLTQRAENRFVGVQCGIMDQFASMMGRANHVIKLDCRSLEYAYAPLQMEGIRIVLCDSRVKHSLAASEYNTRRAECEAGVRIVRAAYGDAIHSLRDVTMDMLDAQLRDQEPLLYRRCAYVVQENERLLSAVGHLDAGNLEAFGQLMYGSHEGLSHWYEVSCPELDTLVDIARTVPGVLGARMMGGGFGGCTINLVRAEALETFTNTMLEQFRARTGTETLIHTCQVQNGTHLIPTGTV
ncbi:galactokinase [Rudanella paleaurantiibacter]|uniref:Galactokinase n=1 Tax=Rudanella paleaurantiibacter TaxID=2614655 RepID=A0A7J5TU53_9BACT|nr:galactokinase [Rudanella paleaurantiibacter]KAB7727511.1 galactokinase [Rudanella paleaurantiibacter]